MQLFFIANQTARSIQMHPLIWIHSSQFIRGQRQDVNGFSKKPTRAHLLRKKVVWRTFSSICTFPLQCFSRKNSNFLHSTFRVPQATSQREKILSQQRDRGTSLPSCLNKVNLQSHAKFALCCTETFLNAFPCLCLFSRALALYSRNRTFRLWWVALASLACNSQLSQNFTYLLHKRR